MVTARMLIWAPALVAVLILLSGILALFAYPLRHNDILFWTALEKIGPAVAGSWVLCAALLSITAVAWTVREGRKQEDGRVRHRKEAVRQVCIGEIKAFWDRLNNLDLLTQLEIHLGELNVEPAHGVKARIFRRDIGSNWFMLCQSDPVAVGELGAATAHYVALSAKARTAVARLNWMNSADAASQSWQFWKGYHQGALQLLQGVRRDCEAALISLGDDTRLEKISF